MCSRISLRLATKYYFGVKKIRTISISDIKILKQKRRNGTKLIHLVSIVLDCSLVCSATYFLEVSACVSLKVVTSGHFRGKEI